MLLHDDLAFHARGRPEAPFCEFEGVTLTYGEAWERCGWIAAALSGLGVVRGARVGVLMHNAPDVLLVIYAASRAGFVPVPLNTRLAPREWAEILDDAEAVAVLADPEFTEALDALAPNRRLRVATRLGARGWLDLETLSREAAPFAEETRAAESDVLVQMYTSGTTGRPKGALLTQGAIVANLRQSVVATPWKLSPGERALVVLPLFHIAALSTALTAASCGGCLVIHRQVDPAAIARALRDDEIVVVTLVPAVIQLLLSVVPGLAEMDFPRLQLLGYGASPISEGLLRSAMDVFKCRFAQGYGMTELCGSCCMLTESDHRKALDRRPELLLSAGKALPGVEVRIEKLCGGVAAEGEVGEILVRGPMLMAGYWNRPDESAAALAGGWMHTGDAGHVDAEGYVFIRDRVKDMVVSGGENVYPAEVEAVLVRHPLVADVAVIGIPDERWGEAVMAVVVARPEAPGHDELDRFCRAALGGFKIPKRYAFVDALPRNASGKVLKRDLRSAYWPQDGRQVG